MRLAAFGLVLATLTGCFGSVEGEECEFDACTPPPKTQPEPPPAPQVQPAPQTQSAPQSPPTCAEPYWGLGQYGTCVWSCSEGTMPDEETRECECRPGLKEVGQDQFGRRVCR